MLAKGRSGIVQSSQSLISIGQQDTSLPKIGLFFQQILHRVHDSLGFAGTQIQLAQREDGFGVVWIPRDCLFECDRSLRGILAL